MVVGQLSLAGTGTAQTTSRTLYGTERSSVEVPVHDVISEGWPCLGWGLLVVKTYIKYGLRVLYLFKFNSSGPLWG